MGEHRRLSRTHDLVTVMRDIGYVSFGKYGQYVVATLTLPLIARILGTEGLGLLAIGMSSYFIGSVVVDLGITSYLAARVNDSDVNQLRGNYLAIRATILAAIGCGLLISLAAGVVGHLHMILLGLFAGGFWSLSEDWVLIGQSRFGASMAYQATGRIGYLILLFILLPHFHNPSIPLLSMLISSTLTVGLTWRDSLRRFGRPSRPHDIGAMLRMGAPVFTSRLLVTSYGQGTAAIYAAVLNAASLGLFSAGDRLVRATQSLLDAIGFALLPRMARKSKDQFWRHVIQALLACLCVAAIATAAIWTAAPLLVDVIFGSGFAHAIPLLRVEVLILPATALTSFVTTAVLTVRQDTTGVLIGALVGTCIAAAALAIAYHTHSVWTLVYGTVGAEFSVALWYIIRMRWLFLRERLVCEAEVAESPVLAHREGG
jgi:O-antigen/teichoic acid export membrane protein